MEFATAHAKGDRVTGKIKSITDFGIFIGLDGGIDGLVHLSDISWQQSGEDAVRDFKKGDEITAIVLQVDPDRERISLGLKQIADDPYADFLMNHAKGSLVTGTVEEVDARGATIALADGVVGYIRVADISRDRIDDATTVLKVGDEVEAKFINVDRKTRQLTLSIRAKDEAEEKEALESLNEKAQEAVPNAMAAAFAAANANK